MPPQETLDVHLKSIDARITNRDCVDHFGYGREEEIGDFYHVTFAGSVVPAHVKQLVDRRDSRLAYIRPETQVRLKCNVSVR